jgi:hypothetical protein
MGFIGIPYIEVIPVTGNKATTYKLQPGENFYLLAKRLNTSVETVVNLNPGVNPDKLQGGQEIKVPGSSKSKPKGTPGRNFYGDSPEEGESFSGRNFDTLGVKIGAVDFDLKRVIDNEVPHEIHIILPKTEIRSVTRNADYTLSETQITLENVDIVHSPRQ